MGREVSSREGPVKISVVIPTRERSGTLASALRTCVRQDYENLEILVSDNCSTDNTREVVASFSDSRIRYIRTPARVGMSQNWEFALDHVSGDYVLYLGDDDGLLPGAVAALADIVQHSRYEALSWPSASYVWPGSGDTRRSNVLQLPLGCGGERRDAALALREVVAGRRSYTELNFLYRGLVNRDVLERLRDDSGRFFHSLNPDLYSALAIAGAIQEFYYSQMPYSVNGTSRHSGGTAYFGLTDHKDASQLFFSEENLPCHPSVVMAPALAILVAESALQVRQNVPGTSVPDVPIVDVLVRAAREAKSLSPEKCAEVVQAMREIARRNDMPPQFLPRLLTKNRPRRMPRRREVYGVNPIHGYLRINAGELNVTNVDEAAVLCHQIIRLRGKGYCSLTGTIKTVLRLAYREMSVAIRAAIGGPAVSHE